MEIGKQLPLSSPQRAQNISHPNKLEEKHRGKGGRQVAEITRRRDNIFADRKAFLVFLILILLLLGDWF